MKIFKNILVTIMLSLSLATPAFALLPNFNYENATFHQKIDLNQDSIITAQECKDFLDKFYNDFSEETIEAMISGNQGEDTIDDILACGIKSGNIKFWMVKYYARHALNFLIGLAGITSVLMIVVGGYFYILGGFTDDKDKGKTIIKFALGGLVLTTLAWIIVNFILILLTT